MCVYIYIYLFICLFIYACIHIYVHVYVYLCIHLYILSNYIVILKVEWPSQVKGFEEIGLSVLGFQGA